MRSDLMTLDHPTKKSSSRKELRPPDRKSLHTSLHRVRPSPFKLTTHLVAMIRFPEDFSICFATWVDTTLPTRRRVISSSSSFIASATASCSREAPESSHFGCLDTSCHSLVPKAITSNQSAPTTLASPNFLHKACSSEFHISSNMKSTSSTSPEPPTMFTIQDGSKIKPPKPG